MSRALRSMRGAGSLWRRFWPVLPFVAMIYLPLAPAFAQEARWVEITGQALIRNEGDREAAARRALLDALFNAALAGEVEVRGHSALSQTVLHADLAIVRSLGQVEDYKILSRREREGLSFTTIRALVAPSSGAREECLTPRKLVLVLYRPVYDISPRAPAWADEMVQTLMADLTEQLRAHEAIERLVITDTPPPLPKSAQGPSVPEVMRFDFLMHGSRKIGPGEYGLVPQVRLRKVHEAFVRTPKEGSDPRAEHLLLEVELRFLSAQGQVRRARFTRDVSHKDTQSLFRLAALAQPGRARQEAALTEGFAQTITPLIDTAACDPLTAQLEARGDLLRVPLGRRHGLGRAAVAVTSGRDHSVHLLELTSLTDGESFLRPLDPALDAQSLAGRAMRFIDLGGTPHD